MLAGMSESILLPTAVGGSERAEFGADVLRLVHEEICD
jgi:hypothetical protein